MIGMIKRKVPNDPTRRGTVAAAEGEPWPALCVEADLPPVIRSPAILPRLASLR